MSATTEKPVKKNNPVKKKRAELELKQSELELRKTQASLERDLILLDACKRDDAWKRNADHLHGIFRLETSVGGNAVDLAGSLQQWARVNPGKPLTLYLCSPGGSVLSGFLLYDQLRTLSAQGHHVTTVVRGYAASMGGVLFLAGDTRLIGAESFVHIHEVSSVTMGKLFEMRDDLKFSERLNKKIEDLYVERTKIKRKEFQEKSVKTEWWLDAEEALKYGVAHELG